MPLMSEPEWMVENALLGIWQSRGTVNMLRPVGPSWPWAADLGRPSTAQGCPESAWAERYRLTWREPGAMIGHHPSTCCPSVPDPPPQKGEVLCRRSWHRGHYKPMPEEPGEDGRRGRQARYGHDPNVITVPQAARLLGISPDLAYSLARRGELPGAFQFGRRWVVSLVRLRRAIHGPEDG